MNTKICLFIILNLIFISCSNDLENQANGYWKLESISYPNGTITQYDSIFYGFQHERLFSFTALKSENSSTFSYGFVHFLSESQIQVSMDTLGLSKSQLKNIDSDFLKLSTWKTYKNTFEMKLSVTGKNMKLSDSEGKAYLLKKH